MARTRQSLPPHEVPPARRFKHWLGKRNPRLANLWRFRRRITSDMRVRKFEFPRTGILDTPFPAYQEMVKRRFFDMNLARARLDYMTALYLRCAGYSKADVANGMYRHTPAPTDERGCNEKINYGRRIVGHAFGVAGDIDIAAFRPTPEQIQNFNREAEEMERERTGQNERDRAERERRVLLR